MARGKHRIWSSSARIPVAFSVAKVTPGGSDFAGSLSQPSLAHLRRGCESWRNIAARGSLSAGAKEKSLSNPALDPLRPDKAKDHDDTEGEVVTQVGLVRVGPDAQPDGRGAPGIPASVNEGRLGPAADPAPGKR